MEKVVLESKLRAERGRKTNKGRKEGLVPAVVYGKKVEPKSLWVNLIDLTRLLKKSGESVIIDLKIDGKDDRNVIIHEMQKDPVSGRHTHIDFFQVNMAEKIEAEIHLEYVGESEAIKALGGILVKSLDKIEVECLPADLPSHIDVDISMIKTFDDHILVKDLKVDSKVEIKLDPETVVALVTPPRSEEELSELEEKVVEDVTKVEGVVKPEEPKEEEGKEKKEKK
ncbi:MAG: 50S ribosomal protein L25 [Parcubacteria group bacterium]|jgi:large subunit ribosomal protein L25